MNEMGPGTERLQAISRAGLNWASTPIPRAAAFKAVPAAGLTGCCLS